jgi:urease accessory protein
MSVVTLRSEPIARATPPLPRLERGSGAAEIVFKRRGPQTVLARLAQQTPCRVLFPAPEPGDPPLAVLLTTSGGLTGGDALRLRVGVEPGAAACVTTQAAEKIYRSLGPDVRIGVDLAVGEGATLEYLPQETILFDRARLARHNRAEVAPGGRLLAAEMLVFGRAARGEVLRHGSVFESWRVRRAGRLVWADALSLDGDIGARLDDPFAFAGARALATLVYVGDAAEALLPRARALAGGAVSLVRGVLIARLFGPLVHEVRDWLVRLIAGLRRAIGLPGGLPRIWQS